AAATAGARGNGLRGARVGAVLLALTLTTPPAHAQGTGEGVAPTSTMAARTVAPTMSGSDSGPAPEEPLPSIPLPGWESLRPEATDAAESDRVDAAADGESVAAQRSVLVTRGDTLWAIAASHLAPEATVAEIAASWPQWYAENRRTIGPDPDLLRPGQVLHPPADAKDLPASDPSPGESP
ncbi:MAG: LysM peptidoglycan-binding domain-containing protein, partial [Ornithinimicrobium sp.]